MDRDETLRRAEKFLRQGRLDAAISEYAALVEENARDLAAANVLGDLYVRAGQIDQAVSQYTRVAEHFARDGFISKATALYKKIVKIHPEDDAALLRAAQLSASQGLTAEARLHLQALFHQRLRRGDRAGAAHAATAHAEIDPEDAGGRVESARMLAELSDAAGASAQLRAAGQTLHAAGKTEMAARAWREAIRFNPEDRVSRGLLVGVLLDAGDTDGALAVAEDAAQWRAVADGLTRDGRHDEAFKALERALAADPADVEARVHLARSAMVRGDAAMARELLAPVADSQEPAAQFAFAEVEFRSGAIDRGRAALQRCLAGRADAAQAGIALACAISRDDPASAFAVIATVARFAESSGDTDLAVDAIERFLAVVPGDVSALEELVRVCGQGFYENHRYRAQVQLADGYLASARWREARSLSEELVTARPDDPGHVERLSRAMAGMGVHDGVAAAHEYARRGPDPAALTAFTSPHPPVVLAGDLSFADLPADPDAWRIPPDVPEGTLRVPPRVRGLEAAPEGPVSARQAASAGPAGDASSPVAIHGPDTPEGDVFELDLSEDLDELLTRSATQPGSPEPAPAGPERPRDLDGFFEGLREERGRDLESARATLAFDEASEHFNRGEVEAATVCLRAAARDPLFRFRAASMLARIARDNDRLSEAAEWLECATDAPAPSREASHGLLYELGDILELAGERARALAVFLELQAGAPGYRDIGARIASLAPGQGRQDGPGAGRP